MGRVELLEKVAFLAGQVVIETPVNSRNSYTSYVRRALIADIEAALVAAGYDMKAARKRLKTIKQQELEGI